MTKAENATLLAVGINCPPPRCNGSSDILASSTLNLTLRIATIFGQQHYIYKKNTYVLHKEDLLLLPIENLELYYLVLNLTNSCQPGNDDIIVYDIIITSYFSWQGIIY